jgi:hypothetical protein
MERRSMILSAFFFKPHGDASCNSIGKTLVPIAQNQENAQDDLSQIAEVESTVESLINEGHLRGRELRSSNRSRFTADCGTLQPIVRIFPVGSAKRHSADWQGLTTENIYAPAQLRIECRYSAPSRAGDRLELRVTHRWRSPESLLLPIGEALAKFVCEEDFATRRRGRRWCSMAICGNRAKQIAHRKRLKSRK